MRYIDADFLIEQLQPAKNSVWNKNDHSKSMSEMIEDFCTELKNAPTADVVPKSEVAREIFEEIEKLVVSRKLRNGLIGDLLESDIAELKNKYTENENG